MEGKTALITGASKGIGKGIALKFASEGCNIAFTDLVLEEAAKETIKEIESYGVKCKGYANIPSDFLETEKVVHEVKNDFGNVSVTKDGLIMRMSETQWDVVITYNLKSAFNFTHAVLPIMINQREGSLDPHKTILTEKNSATF